MILPQTLIAVANTDVATAMQLPLVTQMRQNWGKWVIIKQNAAEILEKELKSWYKKSR